MQDEIIIEQWMLDEVEKANPCRIGYKVGQNISEVALSDLIWVQNNCPELVQKLNPPYPLWVYSSGFGSVSGYGPKFGSGYGFEFIYSSASGDGYGDGYGYGYGYRSVGFSMSEFKKGEIK